MSRRLDLAGHVFGRLTVVEFYGIEDGHAVWTCRCSCATVIHARAGNLRSGNTRSCGCLMRERAADTCAQKGAKQGPLNRKPDGEITYRAAHLRVVAARGPATQHPCADCLGPAEQWSLRKAATSVHVSSNGLLYSGDPLDYDPRCHQCHWHYDRRGGAYHWHGLSVCRIAH